MIEIKQSKTADSGICDWSKVPLDTKSEVLMKAFNNTIELLKKEVLVVEDDE